MVKNKEELQTLKEKFASASGLSFIYEESRGNHLLFLDVLVTALGTEFTISVHVKDTNQGQYLDADSECPQWYL